MKLRLLRSLSRFDAATVEDIAGTVSIVKRTVWMHMQALVKEGLATREGSMGHAVTYRITDKGREMAAEARAA